MNCRCRAIFVIVCLTVISLLIGSSDALAAKKKPRPRDEVPEATCKEFPGSIFKPCVCADQVPATIKYRPALKRCGGRAAAILSGPYFNSFSVVLRDSQNRDRWPAVGYNGCTQEQADEGLTECSAFKCQDSFRSDGQYVCCFGEAGTNPIMAGATRMTIKVRDVPTATNDPLVRICLNGFDADVPLN